MGGKTFIGPADLWGNGNAASRETGCVDALFAAQTEVKMLSQWLGRNAPDGAGGAWPIRVGLADLNAFYDGTRNLSFPTGTQLTLTETNTADRADCLAWAGWRGACAGQTDPCVVTINSNLSVGVFTKPLTGCRPN